MQSIETLIQARWVVPIVPRNQVLDHHSIAIDHGKIIDVLPTSSAEKKYSAKKASEWIVRTKKPLNIGKVLVAFDIPESKRKDRNWLRQQLKNWEFTMVQQSLWLGNGPLPAEFYSHINLLGIKNNIKVFKVSKKQT